MLIPVRADSAREAPLERTLRAQRTAPDWWIVAALVALGAVLRFATLASQSYWFDEAQAAHELSLSFGGMVHALLTNETNPPLYFVLGWVWARVLGTGEAGLRSLSALAGCAVIVLAYLCGRELVSRRAGLVAAALAALSPFMIWYSQEAREYMLLAAMCGASLLCFARALGDPSPRRLAWWAGFSALAVLTHSFALFLVGAEAIWLIYVARSRASVVAAAIVTAVQAALLPFLLTHATSALLGFIKTAPLSMRIQQVPVAFGLGTLSQSTAVNYGLLGASALAAVLIVLLVAGASRQELRGAGIAAALAACVLVIPLLFALGGEDYYIARALMPAWIPLAVVLGAACTARRTRAAGAGLVVVLIGGFIYAQVRIDGNSAYQRPDWRGVAAALGSTGSPRAVVVYDSLGSDPLAFYLPRALWTPPAGAVALDELDVVGSVWQRPAAGRALGGAGAGATLIGTKDVDGYLVARYRLEAPQRLTPNLIAARAQSLLPPAPADPSLIVEAAAPGARSQG
jgi:4-amino-4-deoxy-L-arabinose transferase-like glycosyltransferase